MENNVLTIAINAVKGKMSGDFSKGQTSDAIVNALVEMNGGSTKLNPKTFVRGTELYSTVEELLPHIVEEGLKEDNPLFRLVEYRNIAAGDVNEFYTEGEAIFVVADAAAGIRGVRRQRISGGQKITVKTSMKIVRVYENLGRLLAGRITFDEFVTAVATSFKQKILNDAYLALAGMTENTAGLDSTYVYGGTFDEDKLLAMIEHIEAATGKTAYIYGTKAALRKVTTANQADEGKSDLYNMGYYGKFNGTDMICLKQAHKPGTSTFILSDSKIYVVAGSDAPIKMVNEGEGIIITREAAENNDLTQEYVYGQAYGTGVICSEKMGIYTISGT